MWYTTALISELSGLWVCNGSWHCQCESAGSFAINALILSFALFLVHDGMPNCVKSSHGLSIYCHFIPGDMNLKINRPWSCNKFAAKCVCIPSEKNDKSNLFRI